jgi:hypothetical protein
MIQKDIEPIGRQAIEVWSTICDQELSRFKEIEEVGT